MKNEALKANRNLKALTVFKKCILNLSLELGAEP